MPSQKKNQSSKKKKKKKIEKIISIEDVKNDTKEIKINSPRTLKAMHHLNYTNEDLFYYDFKHYRLDKNTKIVGDPIDIQKRKYKLFLEKRKKKKRKKREYLGRHLKMV